MIIAAAAAKL